MEKAQALLDSMEEGAGASKKSSKRTSKKQSSAKAEDEPMDFVTQMTKQLGLDGKDDIVVDESEVSDVVKGIMDEVRAEQDKKKGEERKKTNVSTTRAVLKEGMGLASAAVKADNSNKLLEAMRLYDQSACKLAEALETMDSDESKARVVQSVVGYLDRTSELLVNDDVEHSPDAPHMADLHMGRRTAYQTMGGAGFSLVPRGVSLRKKGKVMLKAGKEWHAYVLYNDALDALVAFLKSDPRAASNDALKKAIGDILGDAEKIKKSLRAKQLLDLTE